MKKLAAKFKRNKQPQEPAGRITTDTLAEHREKVLAGGRKFKYPVQYQRHKLVINAAIIGASALLILIGLGWYMLYPAQNTSEFMYRVTRVVPVPVAVVDGQQVRYSDYLMQYRSQVHYLTEKEQLDVNSEDGQRQLEYVKTQSMNEAVADAYAGKIARERGIEVSAAELEAFLVKQRQASDGEVSEATYNNVIEEYYGWSPDEYRQAMKAKLLRQKVAYAVDEAAREQKEQVEARLQAGETNLEELATSIGEDAVRFVAVPWVPLTNRDGGLTEAAAKLEPNQISESVQTTNGNGYNFIKTLEITDSQVRYEYIYVSLTELNRQIEALRSEDKLTMFIGVEPALTN